MNLFKRFRPGLNKKSQKEDLKMNAKSKKWRWYLSFVMVLAVMLIPLFLESAGDKGGSEDPKGKIYYLKSGDNQYFYIKSGKALGYFLISPAVETTIKTNGQTKPLSGLNGLEKYISIEVSGTIEAKDTAKPAGTGDVSDTAGAPTSAGTPKDSGIPPKKSLKPNPTSLVFKIYKNDNKYILKFKEGNKEKEESKVAKEEFKALLLDKIKASSQAIKVPTFKSYLNFEPIEVEINCATGNRTDKRYLNFTSIELGQIKMEANAIDSLLEVLEVKDTFSVAYFENGRDTPSPKSCEDLKKILEEKESTKSFSDWEKHLQNYTLLNLGSTDNPSGKFKALFEKPEEDKTNTSSQFIPLIKIGVPLLAVLIGILLLYRFLLVNYLGDLKEIKAQVKKPQTIQQAIEAIDEYLNLKESRESGRSKKRKKKEESDENNEQLNKFTKNSELKSIRDVFCSFRELEKSSENTSAEKIAKMEEDIHNKKAELVKNNGFSGKNSALLRSELGYMLTFINDYFPLIAAKLKKQCKIAEKIDAIDTQNQSFEEKLQFIKERTSNPESLADAIFLVKKLVDEIDREVDLRYDEIKNDDQESKQKREEWKSEKKEMVGKFEKDISEIPNKYFEFEEKTKKLRDIFGEFVPNYKKLIESSPIKINSADYPENVYDRLVQIDEKIGILENDYREYSKLNENLKILTKSLEENEKQLKEDVEKAQKLNGDLEKSLKDQDSQGKEFLQTFGNHVKALGTERDEMNKIANNLKEQNSLVSSNTTNIDKYTKQLNTHLETVKGTVKELQEKINGIREVSGELNSNKGILNNEVTRISEIIAALNTQSQENVTAAQNVVSNIETLDKKAKEIEKVISGLAGQYDRCDSLTTHLKEILDKWTGEQTELESIIDKLGENTNLENQAAETLKEQIQALINQVADVNLVINDLTVKNEKDSRLLSDQLEKIQTVSEGLHRHNVKGDQTTKEFMKFAEDLNLRMEEMLPIVQNIQALRDEVAKVEDTATALAETSQKLDEFDKTLLNLASGSTPEIDLYREFINDELYLNLSGQNGIKVLKKLKGEPPISKEYRACGINLYKELNLLEKKHKDQWHWKLIKPIKDGLDFNIRSFYRRDGKTIYDSALGDANLGVVLSEITEENIKTVINEMHWGQIWEHLLKAAGFFNAYFDGEMENITEVLGAARQKIISLMENYLGYQVETLRPLQLIPKRLVDSGDIKEASNHFVFFRDILPEIKNNKRLLGAEAIYREDIDNKLILFVDALGLIDSGKRIRKSQVVFYSAASMKHYR